MKKTEVAMKIKELLTDDIMEAIGKSIAEPVHVDEIEFDSDHTIWGIYECPCCLQGYDAYDDGILKYCRECRRKFSWYEVNKEVTERLCPYFDGHEERCSMALKFEECPRAKEEMKKEVK